MLKKLIIVYNPRSSKHAAIRKEFLTPARQLSGWLVGKYEVKAVSVDDNAAQLAKILNDGDLVIAAGGDGTALVATNGATLSEKDVTLGILGYGNFNDAAGMLKAKRPVEYGDGYIGGVPEIVERFEQGKVIEIYPLEVLVNGEHWRYALCYATLGLLAEASEMMDGKQMRKNLNTGRRGPLFSLTMAVFWYLKNKGREFLPGFELNGVKVREGTTDYLAVNSPTMAKLMKSKKWYLSRVRFGSATKRLGKFWKMVGFGLRSVSLGLRLRETRGDVLKFATPGTVEIQTEGEYQRLEEVSGVEVRKAGKSIKVVRF